MKNTSNLSLISLNESSLKITLLHRILSILGYSVSEVDKKKCSVSKDTIEQVRALQAKLNIKYNDKYLVDEATAQAITDKLIEEGYIVKSDSFTISGTVYNSNGNIVKKQKLIALDVDLKGAGVYRSVKSIKEIIKQGGFEYLGELYSDSKGNYSMDFFSFQYKNVERGKADVGVYAVSEEGNIIGLSRLVNTEEYSNTGEVTDLHVQITEEEKRTEYEILMEKLSAFLEENNVDLIELADSSDQVKFLSGELDEDEEKIQLTVDAESLIKKKVATNCNCSKLSHELLYGIGRQNIALNWLALYKKTEPEIRTAISRSVQAQIIKEPTEKVIAVFIKLIHTCSIAYVLKYKGNEKATTLDERLSYVLPKQEQRTAFVDAFKNFKNQADEKALNFEKFWNEYLPSQKQFIEDDTLIPALKLNQKLIVLTGNHLPLIEAFQNKEEFDSEYNISAIEQLLEFSDKKWKELISKTDVPDYISGDTKAENYIGQMQSHLNAAFPTKKIASMLTNGELLVKNENVAKGINEFLAKYDDFDIAKTPVCKFDTKLDSDVKKELNRIQRIFQVSTSPKVMKTLMEKNLNSAHAIADFSKKNFVKMYSKALGGDLIAEAVYQRAEHVSTLATERAMKLYEVSNMAAPAYAYSKSDRDETVTEIIKQVPGKIDPTYSNIFGSPDVCECKHCRSVYSAAAYFVDLLRFLSKSGKNDDTSDSEEGKSPLDLFKQRRPDLLNLPLTCENTSTLIPYIDLVNEVMEYYTCHGTMKDKDSDSAAYDTGELTAEELRAAPQNFKIDAYKNLAGAVYPFTLPYHQPLDVIRTYSEHLKTELYDVMKGMQKLTDSATTKAIEAEALNLSQEEYTVITKEKFDGTADTRTLKDYYGAPDSMEKLAGFGVDDGIHEFLRRTGVKYTDLVELLKTKFINPHQDKYDFLEKVLKLSGLDGETLYSKLKEINEGVIDWEANEVLSSTIDSLDKTTADFTNWVQNNFDNFNSVITLYQCESLCNLDTTYLVTIERLYEGTDITSSGIPVDDDRWSKIHRFIRLWRKLKWDIHEVDLMLAALGDNDITPDTVSKLSFVVLLKKRLKLPVNKLATLWGNIDTYGDKSLYKKLFINKTIQRLDSSFEADAYGDYLTGTTQVIRDLTLNPPVNHVPAILAAFRMSEDDLNAIIDVVEIIDGSINPNNRKIDLAKDLLNIQNLSIIYRYTVLSKILKLKVSDFCLLIKLFGINPFSTLLLSASVFTDISTANTLSFVDLADSITKLKFKVAQLQYIFNGELPAESTLGLDSEKARNTLRTISETFAAIELEHPEESAILLTPELVKDKLSLTFSDEVSAKLVAIAECAQNFSVDTEAGLDLTMSDSLGVKYTYDSAAGKLSCIGMMTESEKSELKNLANSTDIFKTSVNSLSDSITTAINSFINFSIVTDINLTISIPESLSLKFTYIKSTGRLIVKGIMSDNEKEKLKNLDGATDNYRNTVDDLYKKPEEFIAQNFSDIFNPREPGNLTETYKTLLNHPAQDSEATLNERLILIYSKYLPLLKSKLRTEAVVNNIAALIGLSQEAVNVIINSKLDNIKEYVLSKGFSAEYFSDNAFTTVAVEKTDASINFDWEKTALPIGVPESNFSVRWKAYITPTSSDDFTITVEVKNTNEIFNLFIDDVLVLNKEADNAGKSFDCLISLNSSKLHKLELEYKNTSNNSGISLYWKTATTSREIISQESSFPLTVVDNFSDLIKLYHQASEFINGFKLTDREVDHFVNYCPDFDTIEFTALLPIHWKRIAQYVTLRNSIPQSQALLTDVFAVANISNPVPTIETLIYLLNLATSWDVVVLKELQSYYGLTVADFTNEIKLITIYDAIKFVQKTGLSVTLLSEWANPETDFGLLHATADLVRNTVKAKYEEEDWMELAGDISDKIRENQKQALISYLLTDSELIKKGVKDADALYEYFLIDVQMGACMDTSRIVQANAAVQMFVQRCLLNLESNKDKVGNEMGVSPEAIDKNRWEWMKNYRLWEANKKIFITPENWLEPEWRDDKSQFFIELESELTQNDITDSSVETAFRNYLTKLNTVANLDICGMYQEDEYSDGDKTLKLLHVFGRTHNAPYQFFYRTCNDCYKWSTWEKVQLDIRVTEEGDNSGVHLLPVVWKNRLFLFWIESIEKQRESTRNAGETIQEIGENRKIKSLEPQKYWEVRLAWSEYDDGKWAPKQLTKEYIEIDADLFNSISEIKYKSEISDENLSIIPVYPRGVFVITAKSENNYVKWIWKQLGIFKLSDIHSKVNATSSGGYNEILYESSLRYNINFEKQNLTSNLELWDNSYLQNSVNHNLVFSNNVLEKEIAPDAPFFYHDSERNYFVKPVNINIWHSGINLDSCAPLAIDFATNSYINSLSTVSISAKSKKEIKSVSKIPVAFADDYMYTDFDVLGYYISEKGFEFNTFHHPWTSQFISTLNQDGIKGLMDCDTLCDADTNSLVYNDNGSNFTNIYNPVYYCGYVKKAPSTEVYKPFDSYTYYKENICFDIYGANSKYNWELFYHIPLYIATRLSKNGKYEEAMKWFHYIFDPTSDEPSLSSETETAGYWKTLPFKTTPKQTIEEWFESIAGIDGNDDGENDIIQEWRDNPFKPFIVANNRPLAFMKHVVIKYVENLREWGDSLFRVFQREQVYEALQLYVMANHILGPRPEYVPKRGEIKAETYSSIEDKWDDDCSNVIVGLENSFPYTSSVSVSSANTVPGLLGIGEAFYFCIPSNEKLLEHWDTIADRLYKIRHCMDINGVERQLALFSPPIDPAMLINAAAQGLSLGSILADLSSPPPIYRFNYLLAKANEFCAEVKSLGSNLLSVLEKKDGEEISRFRASHETMMLNMLTDIKERQVYDAKVNRAGLLKSRETAEFRLQHYNSLLSEESLTIKEPPSIDANITSKSQLPVDTAIPVIETDVDEALVESNESGVKLIKKEKEEMDKSSASKWWLTGAGAADTLAGTLNMIVEGEAATKPLGVGVGVALGGINFGNASSAIASSLRTYGNFVASEASEAARLASYIRREQDWTLQANLAAKEIIQLDKQIVSADIRIQVAKKELDSHRQQIENSKQVEQYLKDKFTNQELYQWMKEQLFSVYKQSFNMAYDMAKKVEKCYQYELGVETSNIIQYGYWNNNKQGLCAGEKLQLALRQLEKSYIEENKREFELTKSVSLALLNPLALQELRTTGACYVTIPEEIYDLDYQGHYFRRIKSVSISLPCIAGPNTTINCTLRLLKSSVRINNFMSDTTGEYQHDIEEGVWIDDKRFRENNVPVKAIATSSGQRDSGVFELNFNDPRYIPFEGAGAISDWKIELTKDADLRQFDYSTISDVLLHINYTAREDTGSFKDQVITYLKDFLTKAPNLSTWSLMRMFRIKHEFSSEWYKMFHPANEEEKTMNFTIVQDHFPYYVHNRNIAITEIKVLGFFNSNDTYKIKITPNEGSDLAFELKEDNSYQLSLSTNLEIGGFAMTIEKSGGDISEDDVKDIVIVVNYKCE